MKVTIMYLQGWLGSQEGISGIFVLSVAWKEGPVGASMLTYQTSELNCGL